QGPMRVGTPVALFHLYKLSFAISTENKDPPGAALSMITPGATLVGEPIGVQTPVVMLIVKICETARLVEAPYIVLVEGSQVIPVKLAWGTPVQFATNVLAPVSVSTMYNANGAV